MIQYINGLPTLVDDETGEILMQPYFKTPFNHDTTIESSLHATECKDPTLANQSSKDECDMNKIIEKFMKTGQLPPVTIPPTFGVYNNLDAFEIRSRIAETNATFYLLPPEIRSEFKNDPATWEREVLLQVERGNAQRLKEIGIAFKERQEAPQEPPAPPVPAGGAPAPAGQNGAPSAPQTAPPGP